MKPGKLYKAAIAAAIVVCAFALPLTGAQAQEHGKKRWEHQSQQRNEFRSRGDEGRRIRSGDGSGPRIERHMERQMRRTEGPAIQVEPPINRAERRMYRAERRYRVETSPVILAATPVVRSDRNRVASKKHHRFRYNHRHHGKRYKHRRSGFTHYYGGYWYALPFWLYGYDYYEPYYGGGVSDWELHVEWCHNRYRSYREDLDAYKGYDGKWHRCISPYSY